MHPRNLVFEKALFHGFADWARVNEWRFAVRIGLLTGAVTAFGIIAIPYIEYYADNLPERRLGVFGVALVFCGFALQSFQYWIALLDIPVT